MNEQTLSTTALEILAIADSCETFRWLMKEHPELRRLLVEAANAAGRGSLRGRLIGAIAVATSANDKSVDAFLRGDTAELAKWNRVATEACEDLGRLLKEICPWATPIESNAVDAPS
jgi:hypothetical protein